MDSLIAKIQLPENEAINEGILEDDEIEDYLMDIDDPVDNEPIADFDDKEDFELAKAYNSCEIDQTSNMQFNDILIKKDI